MKITIKRYSSENEPCEQMAEYALELENITLLEALNAIKTKTDPSLSFTAGCRSGVCGSCAVRVNGTEELACAYKLSDGDLIEPLNNLPVLRDLIVDVQTMLKFNTLAKAWSSSNSENRLLLPEQAEVNELQSDCILCGACYSACPVYTVNEEFLGPFALTRVWRYVSDSREQEVQEKIEAVQSQGIWDCTLCNLCVPVCPQGIAPKQDIAMLRGKSGVMGFMDPNFAARMSFGGGPDFGLPSF
jgi:fumarate reductase iron-sulfur subunit